MGNSLSPEPRRLLSVEGHELTSPDMRQDSTSFFQIYSRIPAFTSVLRNPDQGVELFLKSKLYLEEELGISRSLLRASDKSEVIATYHSLLALIYWLYPNHPGYSKMRNASAMFRHALSAKRASKTAICESYILGVFIELRVLPFLIQSNKSYLDHLKKAREEARFVLSKLGSNATRVVHRTTKNDRNFSGAEKDALRAILLDCLGFSFFRFEMYLDRSLKILKE